jgi:hypothetical protein
MHRTAIIVCLLAWQMAAAAADATKAPHSRKAAKEPRMPALEKLTCRTGPNDHQARLIAEVVKGRTMEFAFYSRLGTRVCSIHGRRGDAFTHWEDDDIKHGTTAVKLLEGSALLEYKPGHLNIKFLDVGRMRFCGMYGELNGTVEVSKDKAECALDGVFDGSDEERPSSG